MSGFLTAQHIHPSVMLYVSTAHLFPLLCGLHPLSLSFHRKVIDDFLFRPTHLTSQNCDVSDIIKVYFIFVSAFLFKKKYQRNI